MAPPAPCDSRGGGGGGGGDGGSGYSGSRGGLDVDLSFVDFCDRRDALLRALEGLLARVI